MYSLELGKKYNYQSRCLVDSVYFRDYDGVETYHHTLCYVSDIEQAKKAIGFIDIDYQTTFLSGIKISYPAKYEKVVWNLIVSAVKNPIKISFNGSKQIKDEIYMSIIMEYNDELIMALKLGMPESCYMENLNEQSK